MNNITCRILLWDESVIIEEYEIIEDMRVLNFRGTKYVSKFQVFWDAKARVIETDTGADTNLQRHAPSNKETTLNVLYAPAVTSMSQLIENTNILIVENDRKSRE